jgi:hypothetical protein
MKTILSLITAATIATSVNAQTPEPGEQLVDVVVSHCELDAERVERAVRYLQQGYDRQIAGGLFEPIAMVSGITVDELVDTSILGLVNGQTPSTLGDAYFTGCISVLFE